MLRARADEALKNAIVYNPNNTAEEPEAVKVKTASGTAHDFSGNPVGELNEPQAVVDSNRVPVLGGSFHKLVTDLKHKMGPKLGKLMVGGWYATLSEYTLVIHTYTTILM